MAGARGEGARRDDRSAAAGASVSSARWDARPAPATRPCGSGAEISSHDGTEVCPPIESETGIGISALKTELDEKQWVRLPAVRCVAMQSSLSFTCGLGGRTQKVKYEKFRQPCGVQPTACWEALESGRLKVGEAEYPMADVALERKIVQVLMEVLVEEDWIWWNEEKNQVATKSGRTTSVLRKGEAILEDGLRVWNPGDDDPILAKVGGANLPIDGGGTGSNSRN